VQNDKLATMTAISAARLRILLVPLSLVELYDLHGGTDFLTGSYHTTGAIQTISPVPWRRGGGICLDIPFYRTGLSGAP
jgi:hypothetical protein